LLQQKLNLNKGDHCLTKSPNTNNQTQKKEISAKGFSSFFDIENWAFFSKSLARLVGLTLEKQKIPHILVK
jgi:hypothetical protein